MCPDEPTFGHVSGSPVCVDESQNSSGRETRHQSTHFGTTIVGQFLTPLTHVGKPLLVTVERRRQHQFCHHLDGASSADLVVQLRAVSRISLRRNCSSPSSGGLNARRQKRAVDKSRQTMNPRGFSNLPNLHRSFCPMRIREFRSCPASIKKGL